MTVNVVLIGFSREKIDTKIMLDALETDIRVPVQCTPGFSPYCPRNSYGVGFRVKYEFVFADTRAAQNLKEFLRAKAESRFVPKYLLQFYAGTDPAQYTIFDARETEEWLSQHISEFGGIPANGYTLVIADLRDLASDPHYFEIRWDSSDAISPKATYMKDGVFYPQINWMFSWGGAYRFYFIDLSAGDAIRDYSLRRFYGFRHVPIQDMFPGNRPDRTSLVSEYVGDYVSEAVRNLFVPAYVYTPTVANSFRIHVWLISQTAKLSESNSAEIVNEQQILRAFRDLNPMAQWNLKVDYMKLSDNTELQNVMKNSIIRSEDLTGYGGDKVHRDTYDMRPVYAYLKANLGKFVDTGSDAVVLPAFVFLLSEGASVGYTWQEAISHENFGPVDPIYDPDTGRMTFSGEALGDLALIKRNERDLFAFGYGATPVIIHEVGHNVGLMHPHSYGYTEDYISSAMSYLTEPNVFSQFDKDAIGRAYVDSLLSEVNAPIGLLRTFPFTSDSARQKATDAVRQFDEAITAYDQKNYQSAFTKLASLANSILESYGAEAASIEAAVNQLGVVGGEDAQTAKQTTLAYLQTAKDALGKRQLAGASEAMRLAAVFAKQLAVYKLVAEANARAQNNLLTGITTGLVGGLVAGIAVGFVLLRRRATMPTT